MLEVLTSSRACQSSNPRLAREDNLGTTNPFGREISWFLYPIFLIGKYANLFITHWNFLQQKKVIQLSVVVGILREINKLTLILESRKATILVILVALNWNFWDFF